MRDSFNERADEEGGNFCYYLFADDDVFALLPHPVL